MVTSPELCCNIGRKEVRVAACHINVSVLYMQQAVEHINKLINLLHLIQNNEMQLLAGYPGLDVCQQCIRISQLLIGPVLQVY